MEREYLRSVRDAVPVSVHCQIFGSYYVFHEIGNAVLVGVEGQRSAVLVQRVETEPYLDIIVDPVIVGILFKRIGFIEEHLVSVPESI